MAQKKSIIPKLIIIFVVLIFLLAGGYFVWRATLKTYRPFELIPKNFDAVIETSSLISLYYDISKSKFNEVVSQDAQIKPYYKSFEKIQQELEKLKFIRKVLRMPVVIMLKDKQINVIIDNGTNVKFLEAGFAASKGYLESRLKIRFFSKKHQEFKYYRILNTYNRQSYYLIFLNNLLVFSSSEGQLKKMLETYTAKTFVDNDEFFLQVDSRLRRKSNLVIIAHKDYFTKAYLPPKANYYLSNINLGNYIGLSIIIKENEVKSEFFAPITKVDKNNEGFVQDTADQRGLKEILPATVTSALSINFHDFKALYDFIKLSLKKDQAAYNKFKELEGKIQFALGMQLQQILFAWLGNEIIMANLHDDTKIIALKVLNSEKGKQAFDLMNKKLKSGFFVTSQTGEKYNDVEIKKMEAAGVFNLLVSILAPKMAKPYYIFLNNYLVISDNVPALKQTIDSQKEQKLISQNQGYNKVSSKVRHKSHVFNYWHFTSIPAAIKNSLIRSLLHTYKRGCWAVTVTKQGITGEAYTATETNNEAGIQALKGWPVNIDNLATVQVLTRKKKSSF